MASPYQDADFGSLLHDADHDSLDLYGAQAATFTDPKGGAVIHLSTSLPPMEFAPPDWQRERFELRNRLANARTTGVVIAAVALLVGMVIGAAL